MESKAKYKERVRRTKTARVHSLELNALVAAAGVSSWNGDISTAHVAPLVCAERHSAYHSSAPANGIAQMTN